MPRNLSELRISRGSLHDLKGPVRPELSGFRNEMRELEFQAFLKARPGYNFDEIGGTTSGCRKRTCSEKNPERLLREEFDPGRESVFEFEDGV